MRLENGLGWAHCRWLLQGRDRGVPDGSFAGQGSERLERRGEYEGRVEETDFAEVETSVWRGWDWWSRKRRAWLRFVCDLLRTISGESFGLGW